MIVGAEERGGAGTRLQTRSGLRGAVIVGEPTSLIPCVATKGSARVDVVVRGKAAHASNPKEGVNAVYPMAALIVELERLAERVSETTERWTGSSSLAVTLIQGGTAQNVIPSECRIHIDRRLVPGERAEPAIAQVERLVREVAERYPDASFEVLPGLGLEPVVIETDEPLVEAVLNATGKRELTGFTACCDLTFLVHEGGIPGVIWGPGSLSEAHQVNETLPLPEFEEAVAMYYKAALAWAGVQAS